MKTTGDSQRQILPLLLEDRRTLHIKGADFSGANRQQVRLVAMTQVR